MSRGATFIMRGVVSFIGLIAIALAVILFPELLKEATMISEAAVQRISPLFGFVKYLFLFGVYASAIPFCFAAYQTWKFLSYIDKKQAFMDKSITTLGGIKKCAATICALYMAGVMPLIYCFAELDDAPGVVVIGFVIGLAPFLVANFVTILQNLLKEGMNINSKQ